MDAILIKDMRGLRKWVVRVWTEFECLRTGFTGGLL